MKVFFLNAPSLLLVFSCIFFLPLTADNIQQAEEAKPYIIYRLPPFAGFWSNFFVILAGIDKADRLGLTPVVDMERYPTLYSETQPIFDTLNAWEYFFEQPGGVSLQTALSLNGYDNGGGDGVFSMAHRIRPTLEKTKRAKELIRKYIRIKPHIIHDLDAILQPEIDYNTLGVHVRGTDRRRGEGGHLTTASADVYLQTAIELDTIYNFSQIFLACDELETVDMFKEVFGQRIKFCECFRVSATGSSAAHWGNTSSRPMHKYFLGREVLMDALLLARCGHLLCGPSNVSFAAIYFAENEQIIHEVKSPGFFRLP